MNNNGFDGVIDDLFQTLTTVDKLQSKYERARKTASIYHKMRVPHAKLDFKRLVIYGIAGGMRLDHHYVNEVEGLGVFAPFTEEWLNAPE